MTNEDLKIKPTALGKTRYEASPLGMSFSSFKKDGAENAAKSESDFNCDSNHKFFSFCRDLKYFRNMSLDSKYNKMKDRKTLLDKFKEVKTKKNKYKSQNGQNFEKCYNALQQLLRYL